MGITIGANGIYLPEVQLTLTPGTYENLVVPGFDDCVILCLTSTAFGVAIGGIAMDPNQHDGRMIWIYRAAGPSITIIHDSPGSFFGNQFSLENGNDDSMATSKVLGVWNDGTAWIKFSEGP